MRVSVTALLMIYGLTVSAVFATCRDFFSSGGLVNFDNYPGAARLDDCSWTLPKDPEILTTREELPTVPAEPTTDVPTVPAEPTTVPDTSLSTSNSFLKNKAEFAGERGATVPAMTFIVVVITFAILLLASLAANLWMHRRNRSLISKHRAQLLDTSGEQGTSRTEHHQQEVAPLRVTCM